MLGIITFKKIQYWLGTNVMVLLTTLLSYTEQKKMLSDRVQAAVYTVLTMGAKNTMKKKKHKMNQFDYISGL